MRKILLSAFEPFGGQTTNASQEVAREVRHLHFAGAQLEVIELPVARFLAPDLLLQTVARFQPDVLLMLGEAGGRTAITPERMAINKDDFLIPDNARNQPREEPIVESGPTVYFSTLPLAAIENALQAGGIPANISNSAGTYVCNHLFYRVMHHLNQMSSGVLAGFMHIPLLSEGQPRLAQELPGLPRETTVKGVRIAIETCLELPKTM